MRFHTDSIDTVIFLDGNNLNHDSSNLIFKQFFSEQISFEEFAEINAERLKLKEQVTDLCARLNQAWKLLEKKESTCQVTF
jgi:hypothetical protein